MVRSGRGWLPPGHGRLELWVVGCVVGAVVSVLVAGVGGGVVGIVVIVSCSGVVWGKEACVFSSGMGRGPGRRQ